MADDEIPEKTAPDDLDPAFDSIDATMKNAAPREVSVTPEALAQIVNEAVAKAITAYQQSLAESAEPAAGRAAPRDPSKPAAAPQTPWRTKLEQLQGDMGISEVDFDGPRAEPAETIIQRQLSAQMGVHDFDFNEIPAVAGEPAASAPTEIEAAAVAEVEQGRPPAAQPSADDAAQEFKWIDDAFDAGRIGTEADLLPAPPAVEPPHDRKPEPVAPAMAQAAVTPKTTSRETATPQVREDLKKPADRQTLTKPEVRETLEQPEVQDPVSKPEVRETRRSLSSWFRSALADPPHAQVPEPAAAMPGREPKPPVVTALPPAAPPVAPPAPPPVTTAVPAAARPESRPEAAPDQNAAAKPVTPEEAAKTTFFTFDPILPVPPRLPREPNEPPKKG